MHHLTRSGLVNKSEIEIKCRLDRDFLHKKKVMIYENQGRPIHSPLMRTNQYIYVACKM